MGNLLGIQIAGCHDALDAGYTYDTVHRVATETSDGLQHTYTCDAAGNRTTVVYGGATPRTVNSTCDALNRLSTMAKNGRTTQYGYDLNGNIVKRILPNGDTESDLFDGLNRMLSQVAVNSGGALFRYDYTCDLVGNVVTNTYDNINRLTTEAVTGIAVPYSTTYGYDSANNRLSKVITGGASAGTTTYHFNSLNQLTDHSDGTVSPTFTYDADGNRATETEGGATDTYSYDVENRLVQFVKNIGGTGITTGTYNYAYDYRTRRVMRDESSAGGVLTWVVYSGGTGEQELTNGSSTPNVEYIRGSDYGGGVGGVLYSLRGGTPSFTHENRRGDVVAKTDGSGTLTYQAQYEGFGAQVATAGATLDRQKSNTKDLDPTGLKNEGMRPYDFLTATFITADPGGMIDGPNLYTYVRQNPWTKFDPEGLYSWSDFGNDVDAVLGGTIQGVGESNGESMVSRPSGAPNTYRTGLAIGHAFGAVQGYVEANIGGGMMGAGATLAGGGAVATAGSLGVASPVSIPVTIAGGALATGGATVATHGALVAVNSGRLLMNDATSGGDPSGQSAKSAEEQSSQEGTPKLGPNDPPHSKGRDLPLELHHGDQMPGSGIHEVSPAEHQNPDLHSNGSNQGVTDKMRKSDRQLHWQMRGQEQGNPPPSE